MELYLHIGAHRTGSTAFQRILSLNERRLAEAGTAVWGPDELRAMEHFYLPEKSGFAPGAQAAFAADLGKLTARRLVLSEENMIGTMRLNLLNTTFYESLATRLAAYRDLIGIEPRRVGFAIRDYASYWTSAYTYLIPRHRLPRFETLKGRILAQPRGWLDVLTELRTQFRDAEIMVWPLEAVETRMEAMVGCFLDVPVPGLAALERRVNVSRGGHVVERVHALRDRHPGITPDQIHEKLKGMPRPKEPPKPLFSDDEMLTLSMRYADEVSALEAGYRGIRLITNPGACV